MKREGGKFIGLKEVVEKQNKHLEFRTSKLKEKDPVRSQYYDKELILKLLSKTGCEGMKIIFGNDASGNPTMILTAADSKLNVISKNTTGLKDPDDDSYLGNGPQCPNMCI
jgi:hypothetical protein